LKRLLLKDLVEQRLRDAFSPVELVVTDDSHAHVGHGASGAHVGVKIVAEAFRGQSRVSRHRMVYGLFSEELRGPIHALAIEARAPGE
jgi:BolA family transcriptional regulator, general stress-responsive regulator